MTKKREKRKSLRLMKKMTQGRPARKLARRRLRPKTATAMATVTVTAMMRLIKNPRVVTKKNEGRMEGESVFRPV